MLAPHGTMWESIRYGEARRAQARCQFAESRFDRLRECFAQTLETQLRTGFDGLHRRPASQTESSEPSTSIQTPAAGRASNCGTVIHR